MSSNSSSDEEIPGLEFGPTPYNYEPAYGPDEEIPQQTHEEVTPEQSRVMNTDWCSCGCCIAMPSALQSICCNELEKVREKCESNACIAQHEGFVVVCLNKHVLETALSSYSHHYGQLQFTDVNKTMRYIAYRQFVRWTFGYLGKEIRVPLPSCAVNAIRTKYPSNEYTGFAFAV